MKREIYFSSFLLFLVPYLLLYSQCKEDSPIQREIDLKHEEIMVIHDEVMPKMKDIYKLKKILKKKKDDLVAAGLITSLEEADDAMMDWMAGYKKPHEKNEGYKQYLADQLISVHEVKDKMLNAINSAKTYTEQ